MMRQCCRWLAALLAALVLCGEAESSEALYFPCRSCHGDNGGGNEAMGAPAIAAMDAKYLARQLRNFRDGKRGMSLDDPEGRQMNLIMTILTDDEEIDQLARFVEAMPPTMPLRTLPEPAADVASLYQACAICHGADGEGRDEMNAPALARLDDWYISAQLRKFRDGIRGAAAGDMLGAQMRASVSNLDNRSMDKLAASIVRLASD